MRGNYILSLFALALLTSASAYTEQTYACKLETHWTCVDLTGSDFDEETSRASCAAIFGRVTAGPCPATGLAGKCQLSANQSDEVFYNFYARHTPLKTTCLSNGGIWHNP